MDKLRDVTMKLFQSVAPEQKSSVDAHITNFISNFKRPDHPPYAAMIYRAIEELNEKRGSSEESISQYIKEQYTDLPLAHKSLLKHHLGELCNSGEILVTGKYLYLLPGTNPGLELVELKRTRNVSGRISKEGEGEVSDKHRETHGEPKGKTLKCNKEKDYNVDQIGKLTHVVDPTLKFRVTTKKDKPDRKRIKRDSGNRGKKDEGSVKHGETLGEAKGGSNGCNKEKEAQDVESSLQIEESPKENMEIDYVNHSLKTTAVSA